jgi:hypothetical protein
VKARDEHVRENWIRAMEAKLVADELSKCRRSEGVNSYETCKDFAERYLVMLKDNRVRPCAPSACRFCSCIPATQVKGYKNVDV